MTSSVGKRLLLGVCGLIIPALLASCGSVLSGGSGSPASSVRDSTSSESIADSSSGTEGGGTDGGGTDGGGTDTGGTDTGGTDTGGGIPTNPSGPDFVLYSLPECSVVAGGALSGADSLTIWVALRNSGPGSWDSLVPFKLDSDAGLHGSGNTAISTGTSFTAMQTDLRPASYNKTHVFTIVADPDNSIIERDESNNVLQVTVSLPASASAAGNVSCTSP